MTGIPTGPASTVVVSHRLPLDWSVSEGWHRHSTGAVSSIEPAVRGVADLWVGCLPVQAPLVDANVVPGHVVVPLQMRERLTSSAIDGYVARALWPAIHGAVDRVEDRPEWYDAYRRFGHRLAQVVAQVTMGSSIAWLHDLELIASAGELRRLRPDVTIGWYCHSAVDTQGVAQLQNGPDLVEDLRACDVLHTQTRHDAAALRGLLDDTPSDERRRPTPPVIVRTAGFDVDRWRSQRFDPVVGALTDRYRQRFRTDESTMLLGYDEIDDTRGVTHRLIALDMLLDTGTVHPDDLRFVQVFQDPIWDTPHQRRFRSHLHRMIERINSAFPRSDGDGVIVVVTQQPDDRHLTALLRAADVTMMTPLTDGLGAVALRHAAVNGDRSCELVLGHGAGAADVLGTACRIVDGADVLDVTASLRAALGDSRRRWLARARMREHAVTHLRADQWGRHCLDDLATTRATSSSSSARSVTMPSRSSARPSTVA